MAKYITKQSKLFEEGLRQCSLCKEIKTIQEYGPGNSPQGLAYLCKVCQRRQRLDNHYKLKKPPLVTLMDVFWKKVHKTDTCWFWTGYIDKEGYGRFNKTGAHGYSWLIHNAEILGTLWVLHRCDVRACVRPDHLFLGTAKDNAVDCAEKGRFRSSQVTRCPRDHEYTKSNTRVYLTKTGKVWRCCKQCSTERSRAWRTIRKG